MTPVFTFIERKKIMVNVLLFMYNAYVAVTGIFIISVNFCFPLFLGMDMYANEFEIKKKTKLK